jgi:uncharacterized protein (DUF433 family)
LIRDGVDLPVASLFVHVAKMPDLNAGGADSARSATEAFLYRRLETLPETAGRFWLNAELPIPFDGSGRMEVDLLSADTQIAIELDGGQHLDNPEAYRRDRRKDVLLQENGFHGLRFLCEDVGKRLDEVYQGVVAPCTAATRLGTARMEQFDRITTDITRMNGEPSIRNLRLTVRRVLEALATYPDRAELKREYPELEDEDIRQALVFAAALVDGQILPLPTTR